MIKLCYPPHVLPCESVATVEIMFKLPRSVVIFIREIIHIICRVNKFVILIKFRVHKLLRELVMKDFCPDHIHRSNSYYEERRDSRLQPRSFS